MENERPRHIAIIMDGNGRWAKSRKLTRIAGHRVGLEALRQIIDTCIEERIEALSVFAFSSENWSRPRSEVNGLMNLFNQSLTREIDVIHKKNVRVRFIGDRENMPQALVNLMQESQDKTSSNSGLALTIAINYGGQWDILQAAQRLCHLVANKQMLPEEVNAEKFSAALSTADLPNVDLFIRTSGELRISNFFLWQLAYAELYFYEGYWPDFRGEQLQQAISWFAKRERRFGSVAEQMEQTRYA